MSALVDLLHRLRDGLLVSASALERGDETEAADCLERMLAETREEIKKLRDAA